MIHFTARRTRALLVIAASALTLAALAPASAHATTIDDKRAEAVRLQRQIEANGEKISALGEQYDAAVLQRDQAQAAIKDSEARLTAAHNQSLRARRLVALRAAALYRGSSAPSLLPAANIKTVNELSVRTKYGALATGRDESAIANLERAQADLSVRRKELDKTKAAAQHIVDSISASKRAIEQANATQAHLLAGVKGEIATLVQQEQRRRDAAARATFLARLSQARAHAASNNGGGTVGGGQHRGGGASVDPNSVGFGTAPGIPAPSPKAQIAINYALAQVGKPYRYAGVGPDAYDCSGLTMMAWAQAGVYMPHASSGQYAMFPHVPFAQIRPGDLIVWGVNGNQHVAMYLGNGMQVAATHTGDYVRVQPVYGGWWGVARPG
jgi:cell wall-associated NlpC family hydrolase